MTTRGPLATLPDVRKVSEVLKARTMTDVDIPSQARQDLKKSIFQNDKNTFEHYNFDNAITLPKKLIPKNFPQTYKSIHRLVETKSKKQITKLFSTPQYTTLEKQAIADIRKGQGKLGLLSDVYEEFSKDEAIPVKRRSVSTKVLVKEMRQSEVRDVENLDNWAHNKIQGSQYRENGEVEELKKEVARMMLFVEEDLVTQSDQNALESMFEELRSNKPLQAITRTESIELPPINYRKEARSLNNISKTPNMSSKGFEMKKTNNFNGTFKDLIDTLDSHENMDLKSKLRYYKGLHEPTEEQLKGQLEMIESEVEKKNLKIQKIYEENIECTKKIRFNVQQIDHIKASRDKKKVKTSSKPTFLEAAEEAISEEELLRRQAEEKEKLAQDKEKMRDLKLEIMRHNSKIALNEQEIRRLEGLCSQLTKKHKLFLNIRVKLYMKILKHGRDTRQQGLTWVLKYLIKEGENITLDDFPEFLDSKSRSYLLQKAKLVNQLDDLKETEKTLLSIYRASYDRKFQYSRLNTTTMTTPKAGKGRSLTTFENATSFTSRSKVRALTLGDYDNDASDRLESLKSLNELDLDCDEEKEVVTDLQAGPIKSSRNTTMETVKSKAISLAFVKEEMAEEEQGSPDFRRQGSQKTYGSPSSRMGDFEKLKYSRMNANESAYHEAKLILNKMVKDEDSLNLDSNKPNRSIKLFDNTKLLSECGTKEELMARIQSVQSEIEKLGLKIREGDKKEADRILKEYNSKAEKVDLEFYLASVVGLAHAEKLSYKLRAQREAL